MEGKEAGRPIALDTTIGELLRRPEFDGYAEYLLPLEFGYRDDWTMRDIPRLLPYHTGVDPESSVAILNRLSERARRGEKVWIDLGREDVGLFAFPGRKGAPFVIVCPGGGFAYVGSIHEGFPYAEAFAAEGMNAFVLQYRTGSGRWACEDLADAILKVRTMADVDPDGYALTGSSAGARMAAWLGSYGTEAAPHRGRPPSSWPTRAFRNGRRPIPRPT
jgi:acetyl esterase/lipase